MDIGLSQKVRDLLGEVGQKTPRLLRRRLLRRRLLRMQIRSRISIKGMSSSF